MKKRIASAFMWFLAGWYLGVFLGSVGIWTAPGPILGATLAIIVAGDPMHRIWTPSTVANRVNARTESVDP